MRMWILSKDGEGLYNLDSVANLYVAPASEYRTAAVRCRFARGGKDLTLASYDMHEQARAALEYVFGCMRTMHLDRGVIRMPGESDLETIARRYETKERSATGKKTVRRGGS